MSEDARSRIAIIEDDAQIRKFLRISLEAHGYGVTEARDGPGGLEMIAAESPDVVILDLGLPTMDGREVIRRLREWTDVPILVLSVRDAEDEKVGALDDGANDYVTKPAGISELLARVRVLLRNREKEPGADPVYRYGGLEVNFAERRVLMDGVEVHLSRKEYSLLALLATHAGQVMTHQQILRHVWGDDAVRETHNLRVLVSSLRQKLADEASRSRYLVTEQGVGYRLRADG
ncbi:response regulator [Lentisalinibacter sediminis]|uniref:response regulator n=1 Tax=Lentisalinibacter sediminis TaxID=2992237 RepID=UPI00386BD5D5